MVHLVFGQPEHGWLPLTLRVDEFELALDVSDVPINPLDELCNSLCLVLKGGEASVWWHLEPAWYQFHLEPKLSEVVLSIYQGSRYQRPDLKTFQYTGDFNSIILPLYRDLKQFVSLPTPESDWPSIDEGKLRELTALVRARKSEY
jgi:hypothetical protein